MLSNHKTSKLCLVDMLPVKISQPGFDLRDIFYPCLVSHFQSVSMWEGYASSVNVGVLFQQCYILIPHISGFICLPNCLLVRTSCTRKLTLDGAWGSVILKYNHLCYLPLKWPELCFYSSRTLGFWVKSLTLIKPSGPILFGKNMYPGLVRRTISLKKDSILTLPLQVTSVWLLPSSPSFSLGSLRLLLHHYPTGKPEPESVTRRAC